MQLLTAKTIINLHEYTFGGIKFAHNFSNKRLSLKFSQGILRILLEQYFQWHLCCFWHVVLKKSCIILKRNLGGVLFQKSLSIQKCCKLNIGYLPENFQIDYNSATLSKLILLCIHLSLKDCQLSLRRSAKFNSILWLLTIIKIMSVI